MLLKINTESWILNCAREANPQLMPPSQATEKLFLRLGGFSRAVEQVAAAGREKHFSFLQWESSSHHTEVVRIWFI